MAITAEATAALRGLDEVDWTACDKDAAPVPASLRGLLAAEGTDDALEAGMFLETVLVCNGTHFMDATPAALPFMLRLLGAPGVSQRGALARAVLHVLHICVDDQIVRDASVEQKAACLAVMAREARALVDLASFLSSERGFDEFVAVLVVACADAIAPLVESRTPRAVRELVAEVAHLGTARERLSAWASRRGLDLGWDLWTELVASVPDEFSASEGPDDDDDSAPVREHSGIFTTGRPPRDLPALLAGDRDALTELHEAARRPEVDTSVWLNGPGVRCGVRRPAVCDGKQLHGSLIMRAQVAATALEDVPFDAWIEVDGDARWLTMLVALPVDFSSFCESCAFVVTAARGSSAP